MEQNRKINQRYSRTGQLFLIALGFLIFLGCMKSKNGKHPENEQAIAKETRILNWEKYKELINNSYVMVYSKEGFILSDRGPITATVIKGEITGTTTNINDIETMDRLFEHYVKTELKECNTVVRFNIALPTIDSVEVYCGTESFKIHVLKFDPLIQ
jgi:hypothetical protein